MSALFTEMTPDPVSKLLDTQYERFVAFNGLEGLAKHSHGRLDILAVVNPTDERGLLRDFIAVAKTRFSPICVWEVWNQALHDALLRYGFTPDTEIGPDGVPVQGLRWDRPKEPAAIADTTRRCPACGQKLP